MRSLLFPLALLSACSFSGLDTTASLFATGSAEERLLAERLAYAHLEGDADRHLRGVHGLETGGIEIDGLATAHVRIHQTHGGLRVVGAQSIVHLDADGTPRELTSTFRRDLQVDTTPVLTAEQAIERALVEVGGGYGLSGPIPSELVVVREGGRDWLAYEVDVPKLQAEDPTVPRMYICAHTGELIYRYENLQTIDGHATTAYNGDIAFPILQTDGGFALRNARHGTYDVNGTSQAPSQWDELVSADVRFDWDPAAADLHFGTAETVAYFEEVHGRDGIDGSGGPRDGRGVMPAGAHFGEGTANAFWTGEAMIFGDGDGTRFGPLTSLDIVAHEFAHGVTQFSAGLVYRNESGALNESMSDVFGAVLDHRLNGPGPHVWLIGEDAFTPGEAGDALRYMNDPERDGVSRNHYTTRYTGTGNNGGVHLNSGIGNLAFYLASEGGSHPDSSHGGPVVSGIGIDAAAEIWYRGLTLYMTPDTTFAQARTALARAAADLHGPDSAAVRAVHDAWHAVGVGPGDLPEPAPEDTDDDVEEDSGDTGDFGDSGDTGEAPDRWPSHLPVDAVVDGLSAAADSGERRFLVELPAGLEVFTATVTGGTGDVDLRVARAGSSEWLCDSSQDGNEETCEVAWPGTGGVEVVLYPYESYRDVRLTLRGTRPGGDSVEDEWILRAANEVQHGTLVDLIGLRAADSVVYNRVHADVAALDALPFVGATTLSVLRALGEVMPEEVVFGIPTDSPEADAILEMLRGATVQFLVVEVGLTSPVATALVEYSPYGSLLELHGVEGFDQAAADQLLAFVTSLGECELDAAAGAIDLGSGIGQGVALGDSCSGPSDVATTCGQGSGAEVLFVWTAPHAGSFRVDSMGSTFDTVLQARGCDFEVCDDDGGAWGTSSLQVGLDAGERIEVQLDGWGTSDCGSYQVNVTEL